MSGSGRFDPANDPSLRFTSSRDTMTPMTASPFQHGDRVVRTCHMLHTTYGGLVTQSHEHHGVVQSVSIHGNVWVDFDDSTGPATKCHPSSLRAES